LSATSQVLAQKSTWLLTAPIADLILTESVNFEHRVDSATFVSSSRLRRRWKRLGFPKPISKLVTGKAASVLGEALVDSETTAVLRRHTGTGNDTRSRNVRVLNDELAILTLSQLGYARRLNAGAPVIGSSSAQVRSDLMLDTRSRAWVQSGTIRGKLMPVVLDATWKNWQRHFFYSQLVKVIRGDLPVAPAWRRTLRNAAVVAGRGYASRDVPEAFLSNMIALEMLLTTQGDHYSTELPRRVEAFIGWAVNWADFSKKIHESYKLRSELIHDGRRDLVTVEDVLFTDMLLFNVLMNLCGHLKLFQSKADVVSFAERRAAIHAATWVREV